MIREIYAVKRRGKKKGISVLKSKYLFRGASTAIITPFSDGKADFKSFARLIDRQLDGGISALIVCGTTGESSTMTDDEQRALISFAAERVGGRVPVLSGASSNSTRHAVMRAKNAFAEGADGVLCVTPYYNKASEDGMVAHYEAIASAVPGDVIVYNVPSRTGCPVTLNVLERLSVIPNISGIKEASGKVSFTKDIIDAFGDRFAVYSGCDEITLQILEAGGAGCVSVLSNILPRTVSEAADAFLRGERERSRSLFDSVSEIASALFCEVNPIPVKAVLADMGLCMEEYRLPLCHLSGEKRGMLREIAGSVKE